MQQRANDVWIVRRSAWILIGWFVLVGLLFGGGIVWPQFQTYVHKVSIAQQYQAAESAREKLLSHQSEQHMQQASETVKSMAFAPTQLVQAFEARALRVLEIQAHDSAWLVQLEGAPDALWAAILAVLSEVRGLTLNRVVMHSGDKGVRITLELISEAQILRYRMGSVQADVASVRFGALSPCPEFRLAGRVGQTVWVHDETGRQRYQIGDWLSTDWRIVGVRHSQLVLKSDLGTTCLGGNPA